MFSPAYVILPFSEVPPADAIRQSLARFERGRRGQVPDEWLAFQDETTALRLAHEACFTFTASDAGGLEIGGEAEHTYYLDHRRLLKDMRRRDVRRWTVRFADTMDLDAFIRRFAASMERHPETGGHGHWLNPLGHWDWWDLGGRFDGRIIGERKKPGTRSVAQVTSGDNLGRRVLMNIENVLSDALGQPPVEDIDVLSNRNIELVATLADDARTGHDHAYPGALVLPPGAAEDKMRWLHNWPEVGPPEAIANLGLSPSVEWGHVVRTIYARFPDHWAACVAFHL